MKKTAKVTVVNCPTLENNYEQYQTDGAKALFERGIARKKDKGGICYAVSTNYYIKYRDALKLYDHYIMSLDSDIRDAYFDSILDAEPQVATAREVKDGTQVLSPTGEWDDDQAFPGTPGIDF